LLRYARRTESTLFHVQWLRFGVLDGILINGLLRMLKKRIVYTAHNVLPHDRDTPLNRLIYRGVYHSVDGVVAHTPGIRERLIREFGVLPSRIWVVRHGVYEALDRPELTRERARDRLGVPVTARVLLFFGRITRYKGLDLLVPTFSRLAERYPSLRLLIAGKIDATYRKEFEHILPPDRRGDDIRTIFGYVPDEDVELLFKAADIVVLPYREGSQSGVLFLSYAYGRPVVISDIGSFPDDVVVPRTGYTCKAGDPRDLERSLTRALATSAFQTREGERSIKEFARENYSWEASARALLAVYASVDRSSSRRSSRDVGGVRPGSGGFCGVDF
jgi:glycosyltransferase involved in cell wall biosynthesis